MTVISVNVAPKTVQEMIDYVSKRNNVVNREWIDEVAREMQDFINEFHLDMDIDFIECSCDSYIQASVYVKNLVGDEGYSVIIDHDAPSCFESNEDFVKTMLRMESHAQKVLNHFKK